MEAAIIVHPFYNNIKMSLSDRTAYRSRLLDFVGGYTSPVVLLEEAHNVEETRPIFPNAIFIETDTMDPRRNGKWRYFDSEIGRLGADFFRLAGGYLDVDDTYKFKGCLGEVANRLINMNCGFEFLDGLTFYDAWPESHRTKIHDRF